MSDIDLDRLGDVWRQPPDQAELAALKRTAEAVHRRARWRRIFDIVASLAVTAVVLFLVLQNPKKETVLVGAFAIFFLFYSHNRQRRLRDEELRSLTGSAEEMIDQSISRIETTIRHHRTTLIGLGPAFLMAILFSTAVDRGGLIFAAWRDTPWFRLIWLGSWFTVIAIFVVYLIFTIRKGRNELRKLHAMRDAYRREEELIRH